MIRTGNRAETQDGGPDYLGGALDRLDRICDVISARFRLDAFERIEPASLQPAELLFDLYGEEIWERAFIIDEHAPATLCLRPDLTVPVARAHLAARGETPARYAYRAPVFRRPAKLGDAALEHLQIGVEIIGGDNAEADDAEALRLSMQALQACGCADFEVVTGDLAIPFALMDALPMPDGWRRRLKRHFWRPDRFQQLLNSFAAPGSDEVADRMRFLKHVGGLAPTAALEEIGGAMRGSGAPHIGIRGADEIAARMLRLAADAQEHPLSGETAQLIEAVLATRAPGVEALARLRELLNAAGVELERPLAALEKRLERFSASGEGVEALPFDASFGRNLSYYSGFVFEMTVKPGGARSEAAPIKLGGGGRYDRLFKAMGLRGGFTGVGAALRPEAIVQALEGGA